MLQNGDIGVRHIRMVCRAMAYSRAQGRFARATINDNRRRCDLQCHADDLFALVALEESRIGDHVQTAKQA